MIKKTSFLYCFLLSVFFAIQIQASSDFSRSLTCNIAFAAEEKNAQAHLQTKDTKNSTTEADKESPSLVEEVLDFSNPIENTDVSIVVSSLLETQKRELDDIEKESKNIKPYLEENLKKLEEKTNEIENSFQNIRLIFTSSQTIPTEMNALIIQGKRLGYELRNSFRPLEDRLEIVNARLQQLEVLKNNLHGVTAVSTDELIKQVNSMISLYRGFAKKLNKILPDSQKLIAVIQNTNVEFEEKMPALWLDYYIKPDVSLFNFNAWQEEFENQDIFWANLSLLANSELPANLRGWIVIIARILVTALVLSALLAFSKKLSAFLPEIFRSTWQRVVQKDMPWIIFGIALHVGAYSGGNEYLLIASIGSLFLAYGQIRLTWSFFVLEKDDALRKSPFLSAFITISVGLLILTFVALPITASILWLTFTIFLILYINKSERPHYTLPKACLGFFVTILIIGALITPFGYARLAMFISLVSVCLVLSLHQGAACLQMGSIIQERLPSNGIPALITGILLAIFVPIFLFLAVVSPVIWIVAFPGGKYLIQNFSSLDFSVGEVTVNTMQVFSIIIVFYLIRSLIKVSCNYIDSTCAVGHHGVSALATPVKTTITFGLWGIFGLYVLSSVGFSLTSLAVVAGGLSVGIGIGLQSFVQNIFSGFSLIFGQNIREGDVVEVAGIMGVVQKISLRATQVRTYDNAIVFVPNSEFLAMNFTNWTHNGRVVRCTLPVGVAYDSDLDLVMDLTEKTVKEQPFVLTYPDPMVLFLNFGASSLDFEVRFWIKNIDDKMEDLTKMRLALAKVYRENNIEIPFPQTDIHIKTSDAQALFEKEALK